MNYGKKRTINNKISGLDFRSLGKSLMKTRKRRGPRIHPRGTPAFTWLFKTTRCFLWSFKADFIRNDKQKM